MQLNADTGDAQQAIARVVASFTGHEGPLMAEEMRGGASTRRFFRIRVGATSLVAMHVPGKSQEIDKSTRRGRRWPFLEVRDLLAANGIRVPAIVHEACAEGVLLVEDLGDHTLANFLAEFPDTREQLYRIAVRDLARA